MYTLKSKSHTKTETRTIFAYDSSLSTAAGRSYQKEPNADPTIIVIGKFYFSAFISR